MQTFQTEQQSHIMHALKSTITSFTFICGIWQQMSNLVNLDSQLDSSHHLVSQVSKSPIVDSQASSILWNPHHLHPLHVGDDFLGHPNGAASTPNLLPNLVSNHLTTAFLLDGIGGAFAFVPLIELFVDERTLDGEILPVLLIQNLLLGFRALLGLVAILMAREASHGYTLLKLRHHIFMVIFRRLDITHGALTLQSF